MTRILKERGSLSWELSSVKEERRETLRRSLQAGFRRLAGLWLADLGNAGCSPSSIQTYTSYLRRFGLFLAGKGVLLNQAGANTLFDWLLEEKGRGLSPATLRAYVAALRSFYAWLLRKGAVRKDPTRELGTFRCPTPLPPRLREEDVSRVLSRAREIRDRVLVELLFSTGCGTRELSALDARDLSLSERSISYRHRRPDCRVMPLNRRVIATLRSYLSERKRLLAALGRPDETALFLSETGSRSSPSCLGRRLRRLGRRAGLGRPLTAFLLRASFAAMMLERGADLEVVRCLLGHAKIESTARYLQVATAPLRETYEKTHPRA
jgi:site-specific recombinase XerD